MKLQLLVSAVKEEVTTLAERMNVRTDAWIVDVYKRQAASQSDDFEADDLG